MPGMVTGINSGCHTIAGTRTADINRVKLAEKMTTDKAKKQRKKLRGLKRDCGTKQKKGVLSMNQDPFK